MQPFNFGFCFLLPASQVGVDCDPCITLNKLSVRLSEFSLSRIVKVLIKRLVGCLFGYCTVLMPSPTATGLEENYIKD